MKNIFKKPTCEWTCHHFETAITFANFIPLTQIRVCKSERVIQNFC